MYGFIAKFKFYDTDEVLKKLIEIDCNSINLACKCAVDSANEMIKETSILFLDSIEIVYS